jgi:hypothetical protein
MLVAVTWRLSQTEIALREAINKSRSDIEDKPDRMAREFGETVTAIRQKMHEIETRASWAGSKRCSAISSTGSRCEWIGWRKRLTIR